MRILSLLILVTFFFISISSVQAQSTKIVIEGSTTIAPIARDVATEFRKFYPDIEVMVTNGGSIEGIRKLINGNIDIAMSSAFLSPQELQLAQKRNVYPVPFRIAYDCIIPIVHRGLPLRDLTRKQLKAIFQGKVDNWQQLGGPDQKIHLVSRDKTSGTHNVWLHTVMDGEAVVTDLPLKNSNPDVVDIVANTPGSIGYISLSYLNAQVKPLMVDSVMGSTYSLRSGSYPLGRTLFLFTNGWPNGGELNFINFMLNPDHGQLIVDRGGFIPLYN